MALKDLVADSSKLTEAAIESIVEDYVRYDPGTYEVVLTPAGLSLGNDSKVLVLLVAISGWQYVTDEVRPVDTKPAALERMTGIVGGTLRPVLKKLKDANLVTTTGDGYAVRAANLDAVGRVVAGERSVKKASSSRAKRPSSEKEKGSTGQTVTRAGGKERRKAGVPIASSLVRLLEAGFFSEDRTLSQVVARLHEMAIIAKGTSLSGPIADLVRDGQLTRKKVTEGNKDVWGYRSA